MAKRRQGKIGSSESNRLAQTIAQLVNDGSSRDVRIFCGDRLVCASYDRGRTLVLNSASREGSGLIATIQQVWHAATRARSAKK